MRIQAVSRKRIKKTYIVLSFSWGYDVLTYGRVTLFNIDFYFYHNKKEMK
jgi:hypothetical protein